MTTTAEKKVFLRCETCGERPATTALVLTEKGAANPWGDHLFCAACLAEWEAKQ